MTRPLPGALAPDPFGRALNEAQDRLTDEEGFYHGGVVGALHHIDDEVPDNAHWKGWVW